MKKEYSLEDYIFFNLTYVLQLWYYFDVVKKIR